MEIYYILTSFDVGNSKNLKGLFRMLYILSSVMLFNFQGSICRRLSAGDLLSLAHRLNFVNPVFELFHKFFCVFCPEQELHSSTSKASMSIPVRNFFHKTFARKSASQGRLSGFPMCFAFVASKLFSVPRRETA